MKELIGGLLSWGGSMLFCFAGMVFFVIEGVERFAHPDYTETQLLVNYWPGWAFFGGLILVGIILRKVGHLCERKRP